LVAQRGGEYVLLELARLFPDAPIYTLVHDVGRVHPEIESHPIRTSFIQRLPGAPRRFRQYLPLFPCAAERWDLSSFDVVLSTSHCVAKGVLTRPEQLHLSYIHTPMRYVWDQLPHYVPQWPHPACWLPISQVVAAPLRWWDARSSNRPNILLANSRHVANRIKATWNREAQVVYPPVDVEFYAQAPDRERHGFLVVSALVPYKRVDIAVRYATRHDQLLTVVGQGSELRRLRKLAGPTVRFVGAMTADELRAAYASAEALLFCGVEDFGIVPVEAMAAGCPVIAFGAGGALETVCEEPANTTGVLFSAQDAASLAQAVRRFHRMDADGVFRRETLLRQARCFGVGQFIAAYKKLLGETR
jgi:glycosyltransferase involved in cell wall biosynthesis